jgi:putative flippase GtrA
MRLTLSRFMLVGLACALLHNAIMIVGDRVGLHYAVSSVLSFCIVVTVGYRLHSGWTFAHAEQSRSSFARYAFTASANLPLSIAGMFVFVDLGGLSVPLASPVVTVLLFAFNYAASRWALRVRGSRGSRQAG